MKINDVLIAIHGFRIQRGDYPKFIYLGYEEYYGLMNEYVGNSRAQYDARENKILIDGVPVFAVSVRSHFNLA